MKVKELIQMLTDANIPEHDARFMFDGGCFTSTIDAAIIEDTRLLLWGDYLYAENVEGAVIQPKDYKYQIVTEDNYLSVMSE